jgi:hypothetical protein
VSKSFFKKKKRKKYLEENSSMIVFLGNNSLIHGPKLKIWGKSKPPYVKAKFPYQNCGYSKVYLWIEVLLSCLLYKKIKRYPNIKKLVHWINFLKEIMLSSFNGTLLCTIIFYTKIDFSQIIVICLKFDYYLIYDTSRYAYLY